MHIPEGSGPGVDPSIAARRAEEARRAAEAARRAAEAARQAELARQAEAARQAQQSQQAQQRYRSSFEAAAPQLKRPQLDPGTPAASNLLTENTRDGQANCLNVAANWLDLASPEIRGRSELLFLKDNRAGAEGQSGHVVIRQGNKVYDPTTKKSYDSTEAFLKEQPHYQPVGSIPGGQAKKILDAPPGSPERARAIEKARVPPELQSMMVADASSPSMMSAEVFESRARAEQQLAKAKADAEAAKQKAAEAAKKAEQAKGTPGEAAAKQEAIDAANKALEAQKAANKASDATKEKAPFPDAANIRDAHHAATLSADKQEALLGASLPIPMGEAVRADVESVRKALAENAGKGADGLRELLKGNPNSAYQKELLAQLKPDLKQLSDKVLKGTGKPLTVNERAEATSVFRMLAQAGQAGGPEFTKALVKDLAARIPPEGLPPGMLPVFSEIVKSPGGAELGAALAHELHASDKRQVALDVGTMVADGIRAVRTEFEQKKKKLDEANTDLGKFLATLGPALTPEQQKKAILEYQERNPAYREFEEAARALRGALASPKTITPDPKAPQETWMQSLTSESEQVHKKHLPDFANTPAGQEWLQDEIRKQVGNEPSVLDELVDPAKVGKGTADISTKFTAAYTKAMGYLVAQNANKPGYVDNLIDSMEKNPAFFGATPHDMKELTGSFKELVAAEKLTGTDEKTEAAKKAARARFQEASGGLAGGAPGVVQPMRALGLLCTLVGVVDGSRKFTDAELKDQIKTVGDGLAVTGDGGTMMLQMMGKWDSPWVTTFGKVAGVGNLLGAIADGLGAMQDFDDGDTAKGWAGTASAAGGLILAAASLQVVPVAGQIVGGLLFIGGTAAGLVLDQKEAKEKKEVLKKSLAAAGITDPALTALVEADPADLKTLHDKGLSHEQVLQLAMKCPKLIDEPAYLDTLTNMAKAYDLPYSSIFGMIDAYGAGEPNPADAFGKFATSTHLFNGPKSDKRKDWDMFFDTMSRVRGSKEQTQRLKQYLEEQSKKK
ncbi:hypothetical protein ACLESO_18235 [Pyxidicoccus sp. 3LG]